MKISKKRKVLIASGSDIQLGISLETGKLLFEKVFRDISSLSVKGDYGIITEWDGSIYSLNIQTLKFIKFASQSAEPNISSDIDEKENRAVTGGSEGTVRG